MKFFKPLLKNWPIKLSVTLALVLIVCVTLFLTGTWGTEPEAENGSYPDTITSTPTPTPENTPDVIAEPDPTPDIVDDPTPTPEPIDIEPHNPLTGIPMDEELTRKRPFAVVISNEVAAMPASGVSQADILYEYPGYSGGDTRMLAIFQDFTDIRRVGAIRSARHNVVQIAGSYDAIFLHGGWSTLAKEELQGGSVTYFNGVEGPGTDLFFRDRDRVPGRRVENLHALVTSSERVASRLPQSTRTVHNDNYDQGLRFTDDATPEGGGTANEVFIRFTARKSSELTFDEEGKFYYLHQHSRDFIDANNDSIVEFDNALILKTSISVISGNRDFLLEIVTVGAGEGYFLHGGKYIEINWSRADKSSPYVYTNKDGSILELGRGRTYIAVTPLNMTPSFS